MMMEYVMGHRFESVQGWEREREMEAIFHTINYQYVFDQALVQYQMFHFELGINDISR